MGTAPFITLHLLDAVQRRAIKRIGGLVHSAKLFSLSNSPVTFLLIFYNYCSHGLSSFVLPLATSGRSPTDLSSLHSFTVKCRRPDLNYAVFSFPGCPECVVSCLSMISSPLQPSNLSSPILTDLDSSSVSPPRCVNTSVSCSYSKV